MNVGKLNIVYLCKVPFVHLSLTLLGLITTNHKCNRLCNCPKHVGDCSSVVFLGMGGGEGIDIVLKGSGGIKAHDKL